MRYGAPYNDTLIEYDVLRDRFMLRKGFTAAEITAALREAELV